MQRRPSTASSRSSVRRRSGAISYGPSSHAGTRSSSSSVKTRILTVQVEDADEQGQPTVLLVQKTKRRGAISSSPLPLDHGQHCHVSHHPHHSGQELRLHTLREKPRRAPSPVDYPVLEPFDLESVPLTPESYYTECSGSPAPRWSAPLHSPYPEPAPWTPLNYRQQPLENRYPAACSESPELRLTSAVRQATQIQRPLLPPSLSLADKLTRKFPISHSIELPVLNRYGCETRAYASAGSSRAGTYRPGRWTPHKWCLFLSLCSLFAYGLASLVCALLTWFRAWEHADVLYVADYDILVLITLAAALVLFAFCVGMTGTILNSRPILAVYALLLWPVFLAILAVGYTSYKRSAFALDRKLNRAWSEWYMPVGRLVVQDALRCCGYNSPLHQATPSARCYARAPLPGCKGKLLRFEQASLHTIWTAAFAVVPLHIANIFFSLLCANHVTRRFGKGIMPRQYRLSGADVQADAEKFSEMLRVEVPRMSRSSTWVSARDDRENSRAGLLDLPVSLRPGGVGNNMSRRPKG